MLGKREIIGWQQIGRDMQRGRDKTVHLFNCLPGPNDEKKISGLF